MNNAIQSFLHDHLIVDKGFSPNTFEAYRNDLGQFHEFLEQRTEVRIKDESSWSKVDREILDQYITDLREKR